jgi:hypothetical protein
MTKFLKAYTDGASFFAIVEKASEFGFSGTGNDFA